MGGEIPSALTVGKANPWIFRLPVGCDSRTRGAPATVPPMMVARSHREVRLPTVLEQSAAKDRPCERERQKKDGL